MLTHAPNSAPHPRHIYRWLILGGLGVFAIGLAAFLMITGNRPVEVAGYRLIRVTPRQPVDTRQADYQEPVSQNGLPSAAVKPTVQPMSSVTPASLPAAAQPRKTVKYAPWVTLTNETVEIPVKPRGEYVLPAWTYAACEVENVLVSEIEGPFTVRLTRPIWDATGSVILVPQGQRVGAKALTAELPFGNERIPGFALSYSRLDGTMVELGEAVIMNAAGTLGLTGEVDHHWWRLVWTSIFSGGLEGGVQAMQVELGADGAGAVAAGIGRKASQGTNARLGRAQDTRPTITVAAGELCQILLPTSQQLPAYAALRR